MGGYWQRWWEQGATELVVSKPHKPRSPLARAFLQGPNRTRPVAIWRSAALLGALARVLLAAGCHTAFQAHALATAGRGQGVAGDGRRAGGGLAVCFGDDLVAHGRSLSWWKKERF